MYTFDELASDAQRELLDVVVEKSSNPEYAREAVMRLFEGAYIKGREDGIKRMEELHV